MSTFQSSQDERHSLETDPRRIFGPTVERFPIVLASLGIAVIAGIALSVGGAEGAIASLVIAAFILLVTVPLTLLLVLGIARITGLYFGTLGQAIVRLTSFLVASEGLLVLVVWGLHFYGDFSVGIVSLLACVGILFWLFTGLFGLDPIEMLITFKVLVTFSCALIFQSLVFVALRFLIFGPSLSGPQQ